MKLDPKFHPEACVSKDETRFNLSEPYFDAAAGKVVATDGRMLVAIPVEAEHGEESRFVSPGQLTLARLGESKVAGWDKAKFPDWKQVFPKFKEGDPGTVSVALNAAYLLSIAKALGTGKERNVVLTISVEKEEATFAPIIVRPATENGAHGLLMPVRFEMKRRPVAKPPEPEKVAPPEVTP